MSQVIKQGKQLVQKCSITGWSFMNELAIWSTSNSVCRRSAQGFLYSGYLHIFLNFSKMWYVWHNIKGVEKHWWWYRNRVWWNKGTKVCINVMNYEWLWNLHPDFNLFTYKMRMLRYSNLFNIFPHPLSWHHEVL